MEQTERYYVTYYPGRDRACWPQYWGDAQCMALLRHMRLLLEHGNGARIHLCCGLDHAVKRLDYNAMRRWIATHEEKVRNIINFDVYIAHDIGG